MTSVFLEILIILYCFKHLRAQYHPYTHYSRHSISDTIHDNQTIAGVDDDSDMCRITVRCPVVPALYPFDHDFRNRRFNVENFLSMHGQPGPPGIPGPAGNPGPRGAVGPQGQMGRSKQAVPIVAFVAYLQQMLTVQSNNTTPIIFEKADVNHGNGYNPTTGVFTAFYRGVYKFSITLMAQMDSIATIHILHNRNNIIGIVRCDCRRRFSHARASIYAELDVNDQVIAEAIGDSNDQGQIFPSNNIYGYTYTHFSGVLLFLSDSS